MNTNLNFNQQGNFANTENYAGEAAKAFVKQVYAWMFGAMVLTALVAYAFASSGFIETLFDLSTGKPSTLFYIIAFSPLAIVLTMSIGLQRFSVWVIGGLFALYSILIGISLSTLTYAYEPLAIVKAFAITGGTFGIMAVAGYTTKADLSKLGSILMMALIGAIIASIFNAFSHSSQLSWILDFVFLIIFTGLVAWKMQIVRQMGEQFGTSEPKMAIWMAFSLYVTFLNLFLTILRLMNGNRR